MKINRLLYIGLVLLLAACSDDTDTRQTEPVRYDLIGRSVNFSASHADPFVTRATQRHNGSFNEEDLMTIYRQYSDDGGLTFEPESESYRIYWLYTKRAVGTSISLNEDWQPKEGETGWNPEDGIWANEYPADRQGAFEQTEADSLTWDNGKTVRFRAWSRSNLHDCIPKSASNEASTADVRTAARNQYYPDYCISDWVTVSGPTVQVPLTLKHQGCRIGFIPRGGNELVRAEICFDDVEDYRWKDNSTDYSHDQAATEHGKSLTQAQAELDAVKAVYSQMCMPAGVDMDHSLLTAMTNTMYDNPAVDFSKIRLLTAPDVVTIGTKTPAEIESEVKRPQFTTNLDGRLYMITIPYNMSNDEHSGEILKLPACTRIKIYLRDVNSGDQAATSGYEAKYHIFCLADAKDRNGNYLFPDGMELHPGYSYTFSVGYHYDHFDITPADDFAWDEEAVEPGTATDEASPIVPDGTYQWWKDAIKNAIPKGLEVYNPTFEISSEKEFLEFISLVNGTATTMTSGLTQMPRPEKTYDKDHPVLKSDYRWYRTDDIDAKGRIKSGADSVTHEVAEAEGYIFYEHYHPANGDQAAYSIEDYLRGPYSFYDEELSRHFAVYLTADLDFCDQEVAPVGAAATTPFRGIFDGYDQSNGKIHTIRNINMEGDGYMFKYCNDVAIRNLWIETTHNFMLLDESSAMRSSGYGAYIVGVSIKAPSSGNPLARELTGSSYVVGCIYQGKAGGALIGTADNLTMYGNMMAATGLPSGSGALLGAYADSNNKFFAPQTAEKLVWGRFMANYYDTALSPGTTAVGGVPDAYRPQEYIRGSESWILKAKNDNMISGEVPYEMLEQRLKVGYYGLAPWKAMNYAIYQYNLVGADVQVAMNCKTHYVNDGTGFANVYPWPKYGEPNSASDQTGCKGNYDSLNLLELNN